MRYGRKVPSITGKEKKLGQTKNFIYLKKKFFFNHFLSIKYEARQSLAMVPGTVVVSVTYSLSVKP